MALSIVTEPTLTAVSLSDAKSRLRVTSAQEDSDIVSMIRSATRWAEHELNWRLLTQTWNYYLDVWPCVIRMPYPPLQSITHIKYYDGDDVQQTLTEDTDYRVDNKSYPARIEPINGWPSIYNKVLPIEIKFICGFTAASLIVEDIKDAIFLRVADLYEHRQNSMLGSGRQALIENVEPSHNLLMSYKLYNEV